MKISHTLWMLALCLRLAGGERIIGGHEARPHSHPYMAFLYMFNKSTHCFSCGGFLIREDFVMTAAHCNALNINVILGAHSIKKSESTQQIKQVQKQFIFPHYQNLQHDIKLLKLKSKAILNNEVSLLPLPGDHDMAHPGTKCSVAGWGSTSRTGNSITDKLQEMNVMVLPEEECKRQYPKKFTNNLMCAGDKMHEAFKGDSGGPLVCNGVASGVVSFTSSNTELATVYTRVSAYKKWIEEVLNST
ncbi:mast cell protease 1A-like [Erpetoichthys calabaricus]|uniref:Mast cell protease 1A-like n=1 Tax=Erpetoichthys calabaricus TaxID=27687 RepID=A0A8C4XC66_ERPCA|nr:mast cell protease 1A-like [Erpetoichthys calabaricus]